MKDADADRAHRREGNQIAPRYSQSVNTQNDGNGEEDDECEKVAVERQRPRREAVIVPDDFDERAGGCPTDGRGQHEQVPAPRSIIGNSKERFQV